MDYFAYQDREANAERRERRAEDRARFEPKPVAEPEPVVAAVDRIEVIIVAPCGHPLKRCRYRGTSSWQNRWTCGVCGRNFSR